MSDEGIRAALQDYTAQPPVSALNSTAILGAARRSRRNHTIANVTGGLLAIVLTATVVGVAVRSASSSHSPAAPNSSPAITSCAGPRPSTPMRPGSPLPADLADWGKRTVTCHLGATLPRMLPGATFERAPGAPAGPFEGFIVETPVEPTRDFPGNESQPLVTTSFSALPRMNPSFPPRPSAVVDERPRNHRVDAIAVVRDQHGAGDLWLYVGITESGAMAKDVANCKAQADRCTVRQGPRGETLVVWAPKPDNRKYLEATVTAYRGNTTVWIGATNTDRKTPVGQTHEPTRPSPVMTADQVAELALSSDLLLYP